MCGFAVIDHRSRGYNFIYDSHLNLTYLKFGLGFQAASAQAQFYTQRSRIYLSTLRRQWTCFTNKTKTSPVLCSAPLQNTRKQFFRTHMHVRESYRLLFISIPVSSRSLVKASQNPPAKLYLKTKRCISLKLLIWREPPFILTHWRLKEIACDPSLIPWRFLEYFRASKNTKINHMRSNHKHKIRFQVVVYLKSNK